jgi:hypothetical protein
MMTPQSHGEAAACFPAGTLVRMADGSERAIERVRPNEHVVTAEGRTGMVRQLLMRREAALIIRLTVWDHAPLYVTPEHPVLTRRDYIPVGDLRLDDWIGLTRYRPKARVALNACRLISPRERTPGAVVGSIGGVDQATDGAAGVAAIPEIISLTPRFGRLVGLFLGAGITTSNPMHFTFGMDDRGPLTDNCLDLLRDLGVAAETDSSAKCRTHVFVYGAEWARLWQRLCGTRAVDRMVHPLLMGDDAFLCAMLDGWMACEGRAAGRSGRAPRSVGSTVSKVLAFGMYDIAQALGLRPIIRWCPPKVNRQTPWYEVEIQWGRDDNENGDNPRCAMDETHVWRRVRGIEQGAFDGMVYNLSVEGDESYVAQGIGVHNCAADRA